MKKFKGDEFKPNQKAKIDWGLGLITNCTILYWSKYFGGWWYIELSNGGMHYTRNLLCTCKSGKRYTECCLNNK